MGLSINIREIEGVIVLDLRGNIPLEDFQKRTLENQVKELLAGNKKKILLNLANYAIWSLRQWELGSLVRVLVCVRDQGGQLKLVNVSKRIQHILVLARLITVFEIYATEEEALASFK
ncbi:MAG: STAS domain-containing protein [Terriglobia bacterium]